MGTPIISLGGLFMICPKCKFSNDATSAKFCPKCGFEYAKFHDIMIEKFTPKKKVIYTIILATCLLNSILGIVFFATMMEKYFFGVFPLISLERKLTFGPKTLSQSTCIDCLWAGSPPPDQLLNICHSAFDVNLDSRVWWWP